MNLDVDISVRVGGYAHIIFVYVDIDIGRFVRGLGLIIDIYSGVVYLNVGCRTVVYVHVNCHAVRSAYNSDRAGVVNGGAAARVGIAVSDSIAVHNIGASYDNVRSRRNRFAVAYGNFTVAVARIYMNLFVARKASYSARVGVICVD